MICRPLAFKMVSPAFFLSSGQPAFSNPCFQLLHPFCLRQCNNCAAFLFQGCDERLCCVGGEALCGLLFFVHTVLQARVGETQDKERRRHPRYPKKRMCGVPQGQRTEMSPRPVSSKTNQGGETVGWGKTDSLFTQQWLEMHLHCQDVASHRDWRRQLHTARRTQEGEVRLLLQVTSLAVSSTAK